MSVILAIDTSSTHCCVALSNNGSCTSKVSHKRREHAQRVLPMIEELLCEAALDRSALNAIAVVSGPGSFTGLRIGMGVSQGLAMALSIPVIPVSSLAVMAMSAVSAGNFSEYLVAITAREDEIYFAAYSQTDLGSVCLQGQEQVCHPGDIRLSSMVESRKYLGIGDGWQYSSQILAGLGLDTINSQADFQPKIVALCELAETYLRQGLGIDAPLALPNYLKEASY